MKILRCGVEDIVLEKGMVPRLKYMVGRCNKKK